MPLMTQAEFDRLAPDLLRRAIMTPYRPDTSFIDQMLKPEPWPHIVHYQKNRVIYVPPDEFLMWKPQGPSDCTWIVPGTLERKL